MLNADRLTDHQFSGGHQKKEVMGLGWAGGRLEVTVFSSVPEGNFGTATGPEGPKIT
jgi:hypothetical protein